jgi:hypothetical protein
MSNIVAMALTALSIIMGGYGLYKAAFARGYANGYEDAAHPDAIDFTPD